VAGRRTRREKRQAAVRRARAVEATRVLEGPRTFGQTQELVAAAVKGRFGGEDTWVWVRDLTEEWVVYELETESSYETWQIGYTVTDEGVVTLAAGEPMKVIPQTEYTVVAETTRRDTLGSRILEAKGESAEGGRIFGMQIIAVGTSLNGVRYTEAVLTAAAPLYEGAKAYDHHRSMEELNSGSLTGLCGTWRNVEAKADGIYGDLYLLPGATHVAELLDASLSAIESGLPGLAGVSHDVQIAYADAIESGRRIREATAIEAVLSADVVADPAAGGRVVRMVAGGVAVDIDPHTNPITTTPKGESMNLKELLAALRAASAEERAALLTEHAAVLDGAGYTAEDVPVLLGEPETGGTAEPPASERTPEPAAAAVVKEPAMAGAPAAAPAEVVPAEDSHAKESIVGRMLIREAVTASGLGENHIAHIAKRLPARVTEAQVLAEVDRVKETLATFGSDVPGSKVGGASGSNVRVTEDALDKKKARLTATFNRDWQNGYTRISEAYLDITGSNPSKLFSGDLASEIIKESWGGPIVGRVTESLTTASWGEILADVMGKRMVAEYSRSQFQTWQQLVTIMPVIDFKSQKLIRVGGYGTLPTVGEGAPYQALTTPTDEQVTYSVTKRGGTEDYTMEMARNDDMRKLVLIPDKLARAAAITVYRAVFDLFTANPTMAYDSTALFDAAHGNTGTTALSETGLDTARQKMRDQAAYGDSVDILSMTPRFLLVPNELENTANKLTKGQAALVSASNYASDMPNLHLGMDPVVVDYWTDATDWFVVADPNDCPTIEVGFLDGKVDPELFMQDDPSVGSVFTADKVTWKIRHIHGLTVVDHRAFQRMVVT
jgi:hypothetical protein